MRKTTIEQINSWLSESEGTNLEFKEAKNRYDTEKLANYCVALANEGGGQVILGVSDGRPRVVVGTKAYQEPGEIEAALFERLQKSIKAEEVFYEGDHSKRILIFHIPPRDYGDPWCYKGRFWKREGDALLPMGNNELRKIFQEVAIDFTAEVCEEASLKDLDESAVLSFRSQWAEKEGARISTYSVPKVLQHADLIDQNQKITYAALILFATQEAITKHLPQAEIILEYKSSEKAGPADVRMEFFKGFLLWQEDIWEEINLRNSKQSVQQGLRRKDLWAIDEISIREAVLNAVAHRDYRYNNSIFVRQFPSKIEVTSPGGFPNGVTPENILDQQNPRNRRLAEALRKTGYVERSGQGVDLMFETAIRQGKELPSFKGTTSNEVRITLNGVISSPELVKFLDELGDERLSAFSTYDFLTLDHIYKGVRLSPEMKERLPNLYDIGAIEKHGAGRGVKYTLSRDYYSGMGQREKYTRESAQVEKTKNKQMILDHLRAYPEGASRKDFGMLFREKSENTISNWLNELKNEGLIRPEGRGPGTKWRLVINQD